MQKGFSIIEILLGLAIVALIISVFVLPLTKDRQSKLLLQSVDDIVAFLNTARSNTLSSINSQAYGIKIENSQVTLFVGPTYSPTAIDNQVMALQNGIDIPASTILLNGAATSILFDRLTGATSQYGTILIRVSTDPTKNKTITIEKTGLIKTN